MTANLVQNLERSKPLGDGSAHQLAICISRILGTLPEDAVGFATDDALCSVHAAIASQYDTRLAKLLIERGVKDPQPVTPSVAIPLLRAAYDESRPELQDLWVRLLATAMDPARAKTVRRSFIEALSRLDPLDARVLAWMPVGEGGRDIINLPDRACKE
ncbi:MAG: Abi-alpha family protein, partial [Stellaceae bacterium]